MWYVYRCHPALTAGFNDKLGDQGLGTHFPVVNRRVRLPRRRAVVDREYPAFPSFLFVDFLEGKAPETLMEGRVRRMLFNDRHVTVSCQEIENIELNVRGNECEEKQAFYQIGSFVEVHLDAFHGMEFKVIGHREELHLLEFPGGSFEIEIHPFLLSEFGQ